MNRRFFLLGSAIATTFGQASFASGSLGPINAYFNSFKTAQSRFAQVNADGTVSTGLLSMRRPGRARFEYDADGTLVIAGGGQVAIFDPFSNTLPEQYPLRRTPLAHILARRVDLESSGMLANYQTSGNQSAVTLQDPENADIGTLQLIFDHSPMRLTQWVVTNEFGERTTLVLEDLQFDVFLSAALFSIPTEIQKRGLAD